jgi:DNA-3-methyladenine glycosylase II
MLITIELPPGYRVADILAFHGRDREGVAEHVIGQVTGQVTEHATGHATEHATEHASAPRVRKGVLIEGVPVLLDVTLGASTAQCHIEADGAISARARQQIDQALQSMLGLRIDPEPFLKACRNDAMLGALTRRQGPLRIVQSATMFEALSWAVIGQQINLNFAIALRRTLIMQAGRRHSSGLWCTPEARDVARLQREELTSRKFSGAKADTVLRLARLIDDGELLLEPGDAPEHLAERLLAIKGIGPWTVNYALLRGAGHADCSLHGDVAIRAAFQALQGAPVKPDMAHTETLLARYAPHRSMAAAHLWASLKAEAPA